MDARTQRFILDIIEQERDMTIATVRDDGFPQATTVSYASDGMTLYFGTGRDSQKVVNIQRCPKVSLTINRPYDAWSEIKGLSMGGLARLAEDAPTVERAASCLMRKFPEIATLSPQDRQDMVFVEVVPNVVSILDYSKGFGHTQLVRL